MTQSVHLSVDLISRLVDDELTPSERLFVEGHLVCCAACRQKRSEWADVAEVVEDVVMEHAPTIPANSRQRLISALTSRNTSSKAVARQETPGWWKWGGVAAAVALLAFLGSLPPVRSDFARLVGVSTTNRVAPGISDVTNVVQDDDALFIPLPYSGMALGEGEEEIVRVRMPAEVLENEGIIPAGMYAENSLVDADLILGLDGQPQGIRLVNADQF